MKVCALLLAGSVWCAPGGLAQELELPGHERAFRANGDTRGLLSYYAC